MQQSVGVMGAAKPGQILKGLHSNFSGFSAPTKDTSVRVGCFVQLDGKFVKGASGNAITGKIAGVVVANEYFSGVDNSDTYPANVNVFFINKGCIAIETKSNATAGQYVFLKNDNGALVFNDSDTLANHTYTGFRVVYGASGVTDPQIIGIQA